jgi:putative heme transporter
MRTGQKRWLKRGVAGGVGVAVIVGVYVFVLPQFANYREVWDAVKGLSWEWVLILIGAVVLNMLTFAPPWMAALPGLRFIPALLVTQASTASTYLAPGGPAVGIGLSATMLLAWGFDVGAVTLAVTLTGTWNQLAILGFPAIGLALLTVTGHDSTALQTIALIGLAAFVAVAGAFALAFASAGLASKIGDLAARLTNVAFRCVRRKPVAWGGEDLVRFRARAIGLLRRRWHVLTLATLAGQLTVFLVLLVCLRALGVTSDQVDLVEAFAGWSLARVLGSIPITPGGLGFVELGLTSVLVGFGGNNAGVVAAVLLYRALTILPTLALGAAAGALWSRYRRPIAMPPAPSTPARADVRTRR